MELDSETAGWVNRWDGEGERQIKFNVQQELKFSIVGFYDTRNYKLVL